MSEPIMCRGVDISAHVASMFDALVGSMDWGSGFLDSDQIDAIMTIGALAGWDLSKAQPHDKVFHEKCPMPPTAAKDREATQRWYEHEWKPWNARKEAAIESWRKQFVAKANALADEYPDE